nr:hypothetical protein [Tanacetum cinerariifolium]
VAARKLDGAFVAVRYGGAFPAQGAQLRLQLVGIAGFVEHPVDEQRYCGRQRVLAPQNAQDIILRAGQAIRLKSSSLVLIEPPSREHEVEVRLVSVALE